MKIKKINSLLLLVLIIAATLVFCGKLVVDKLADSLKHEPTVVISKPNSYYKDFNYKYVGQSEEFIPYSRQDLKNVFFSVLNNGYNVFTFYCPPEYPECINDVHELSSDTNTLTHINNFVSPLNNFSNLRVIYDENGEVTIEVSKLYTREEITAIDNEVNSIINNIITDEMDNEEKVLAVHDYIINKAKYDVKRIDGDTTYKSNKAYGPLFENYAVCGGYADAMALFLNKFNIPNFKVASATHVWNAIYINDIWLHLDLTWDDPVNEDGTDTINYKFFLISTSTLEGYQISDHEFDKTIYRELSS